jgi:hypothetical protein
MSRSNKKQNSRRGSAPSDPPVGRGQRARYHWKLKKATGRDKSGGEAFSRKDSGSSSGDRDGDGGASGGHTTTPIEGIVVVGHKVSFG